MKIECIFILHSANRFLEKQKNGWRVKENIKKKMYLILEVLKVLLSKFTELCESKASLPPPRENAVYLFKVH